MESALCEGSDQSGLPERLIMTALCLTLCVHTYSMKKLRTVKKTGRVHKRRINLECVQCPIAIWIPFMYWLHFLDKQSSQPNQRTYSKIPILRPPLGLSKSGLKDHFCTDPKVISNQRYTGCGK